MQNFTGHIAPHTPANGFFCKMSAAALFMSEFLPTFTAIIKSAGLQSVGHAVRQGFSAQYSHLSISDLNCAFVKK